MYTFDKTYSNNLFYVNGKNVAIYQEYKFVFKM